jgi:SnoaL-like domain
MKRLVILVVGLAGLASLPLKAQSPDGLFAQGAIAGILDNWHGAAAAADEAKYFSYFTPDAIYLGTDPTERWTRDEFRKWAHPYFARAKAWSFRATSRWISFSPDRNTAWFDEMLDTPNMGVCRGSGVLVRAGETWKIAQYNLSIPIPNALTDEVVKRIRKEK